MDRAEQILDVAEREMRKGGADSVSFRDIASEIGIKSASVHYHFPTKADLMTAVTDRYAARFLDALGDPAPGTASTRAKMEGLADAYIAAYRQDTSTCLCAVLGSVVSQLPDPAARNVQDFYRQLLAWVEQALGEKKGLLSAPLIISLLQGAMVLAIATDTDAPLAEARSFLIGQFP